jgi:hypothetical protein
MLFRGRQLDVPGMPVLRFVRAALPTTMNTESHWPVRADVAHAEIPIAGATQLGSRFTRPSPRVVVVPVRANSSGTAILLACRSD